MPVITVAVMYVLPQGLRLKKQHSTGELEKRGTSASIRSTGSSASWMSTESSQSGLTAGSHHTDSNASFIAEVKHKYLQHSVRLFIFWKMITSKKSM